MSSQFSLFKTRRFSPFFATQFLGAFNDNLFKNALIVLITFQTAQWSSLSPGLLVNLAAGIFILPFFLFSATAGQLADKYDKALLSRLVKGLEIAIVLLIGLGFWLQSLSLLMVCLFLLGLQSTLFGPVKYALLPQHLHAHELVGGNALVEAGTFVSILLVLRAAACWPASTMARCGSPPPACWQLLRAIWPAAAFRMRLHPNRRYASTPIR